ncbi:MAG: hypothetical protein V4707_05580 [Pseudomonadota bacterium]
MTAIQSSLKVGVDVPWVTSWTAETITGVAACPSVGGRPALCQMDHAGFGKPQYSKNHLLRQRLTVSRMLCPMCGDPTVEDDRWTQTGKPRAAGWLRAEKGFRLPDGVADDQVVIDAGAIAPLHRACATRSMAQCPHLKADPELKLIRFPKAHVVVPLLAEAEDAHAAAKLPPVIGFLQLCGITGTIDRRWRRTA